MVVGSKSINAASWLAGARPTYPLHFHFLPSFMFWTVSGNTQVLVSEWWPSLRYCPNHSFHLQTPTHRSEVGRGLAGRRQWRRESLAVWQDSCLLPWWDATWPVVGWVEVKRVKKLSDLTRSSEGEDRLGRCPLREGRDFSKTTFLCESQLSSSVWVSLNHLLLRV